jgi:hypothetical protein
MSKEILIDINGGGAMHSLHFEEMSLLSFGKAEIQRATDIKFNSDTQLWDIRLLDHNEQPIHHYPDHLLGFEGYEEARQHEVRYLQECRRQDIGVISNAADELGSLLREAG